MPGTTSVTSSSTDTPTRAGVRDDVDLDRTVWFGGGEAYHRATDWGPACVDQIGRLDEHTLGDAVDEGKRPCRQCEPVDYRRVATDGGVVEAPLEIHVRPRDGGPTSFELGEKTARRLAKMLDAGADEYADRVWPDNEDGKAKAIANTILRSFDEPEDDRNAHADAVAAQLRLAEENGNLPDGVSR